MQMTIASTGWFQSDSPVEDYFLLGQIAKRSGSVFGDPDKIDKLDLVGLEEDFKNGTYQLRDHYLGFVDGPSRDAQARNAVSDLNFYLKLLRDFQRAGNSLQRVAAVRFFQEDYLITKIRLVPKPAPTLV